MQTGDHGGPIFTYSLNATALSTGGPSDLWCVTAPSNSRLAVREIIIGQNSDAGDAAAEMFGILLLSGSTAIGGGTAITGVNLQRYSGAATANSSVTGPSTTLASTTSASIIRAEAFNIMAGYRFYPVPSERPIIGLSQRFVVRCPNTPADPVTLFGTLMLQEIGQTPQ
jgi:hypothetical protein